MSRFNRSMVAIVFGCTLVGGAALALRSSALPAATADEKATAKFEVYKDKGGEFRWRLRATNTQVLATSGDGYKAKRDCLHAIESVKRAVANAPVEEAEGQEPARGEDSKTRAPGAGVAAPRQAE